MAYAIQVTIGTGSKISLNYQSQDVSVSLTYELERSDTDVLQVVQERAAEVAQAHQVTWQRIRDAEAEDRGRSSVPAPPPAEAVMQTRGDGATAAQSSTPPPVDEAATAGQQAALRALLAHTGVSDEQVRERLQTDYACVSIEELTQQQASQWLLQLQRQEREQAQQRRLQSSPLNGRAHQQ